MKIKTITCHDVYNYGASLQAYALQHYLELLGHDVEVIDYKPDYLSGHYKFWFVPQSNRYYSLCKKSKLFHLLYCLRLAPETFRTWRRIKPFNLFKKNRLKCTSLVYKSNEELKKVPPVADLYIAGSDQIWNCLLPNGKDEAFFLGFGNNNTRRISYAASFAMSEIPEEYRCLISNYMSHLDAISVRETSGVSICESMGYKATQALDPVFLLSGDEWRNFAGPKIHHGHYILIYNLFKNTSSIIKQHACQLKSKKGWEIIAVNDVNVCKFADKNYNGMGPIEFVNLIANASYVIADSFHATAFSTILHIPFSVYYQNKNSARMIDFLSTVNLLKCFNPSELTQDYNWDEVQKMLDQSLIKSKNFLTNFTAEQ